MNKNWYYSIALTVVILNALFLLGIINAIGIADLGTNLFNTGITPGAILGIANIFVAFWIYKKYT